MEEFEPIKFIGKGAYGVVWLVRKKATGDEYAMKIVDWADRVNILFGLLVDAFIRQLRIDCRH